ncbi:DUF2516 family protein [Kineococcus sp. SYSU DK002]|uniref:DUF2516 family protein n=1 Tax=Kineococcus sp. SYSU DK002 TaxID=3383123 RepID=UPI003D7E205D
MDLVNNLQYGVLLILGIAALGLEVWALIDCARRPAAAFVAAGKRTKNFWLAITAVATAVGFVSVFSVLGIFGVLGVVGAAVYLADVRPAVRGYGGGPRRRDDRGNQGPYGPW